MTRLVRLSRGFLPLEHWSLDSDRNQRNTVSMKNWILFLTLAIFSTEAQATEMVGALSAGMGGTGRAAVESNESLYLNPASIALFEKFYTGVSYLSGFTANNVSRNTYSVTMTDGTKDLLFPGSLSYRRHKINDRGSELTENEFRAGAGYRINSRLSVGLGGSYLRAEAADGTRYSQTNMDAGILLGLLPNWGLSVSGENLINADANTPAALRRPSRVAIGTQFVFDRAVTLRYEALQPIHIQNSGLLAHRAGFSVAMKGLFFLNTGYSVDDTLGQNWASVGLAWKGPRLKLAYSLQNEARAGLGNRHYVDLWMDL